MSLASRGETAEQPFSSCQVALSMLAGGSRLTWSALSSGEELEEDPEPTQGLSDADLREALRSVTRERDELKVWSDLLTQELATTVPFITHDVPVPCTPGSISPIPLHGKTRIAFRR